MGQTVHHTPGRLRIKFSQLRHRPDLARQAESRISAIHGVRSAQVSTVTGSLLVRYDPRAAHPDQLFSSLDQMCSQLGLFGMQAGCSQTTQLDPLSAKVAGKLMDMVVEKCVERSALALLGVLL